ncbi:MAG: hypothetical protein AAF674_15440 [Pseudomonadota bacterium]
MTLQYEIRPFRPSDAMQVRKLFVEVNQQLAPEDLKAAFDTYVARCLQDEFADLTKYYSERNGAFFVAHHGATGSLEEPCFLTAAA